MPPVRECEKIGERKSLGRNRNGRQGWAAGMAGANNMEERQPKKKAGDMGVVNEMRNRNVGPQGQVRAPTRRSRLGHVSMLSLSALALLCFVHHCSALKKLDLDDLEDLEKNDDMQGGSGKMELKRGQEKEDARSMKLPREEVKMGQTHDHLYGDRESSYSGDGIPTSSGHLDVSVAKMEAIFAAIRPVKLLLFIARNVIVVLRQLTQSSSSSAWDCCFTDGVLLINMVVLNLESRYHAYTSGMDKRSANAIKAIGAALHPEQVQVSHSPCLFTRAIQVTEAFRGLHYGLVSCLASVVSPLAGLRYPLPGAGGINFMTGAAGVGLSLGKSIDRHVQPFLRRYVMTDKRLKALTSARMRLWVDTLTTHASEVDTPIKGAHRLIWCCRGWAWQLGCSQ
eukprot:746424-Hanusia_phi.AAC.8